MHGMRRVPIESIRVGERKVALDVDRITQLRTSIAEVGLYEPIGVRPDGTLVYGYHRLEACKRLGWSEIPAVIVDGDDLRAELAKMLDNLTQRELTVMERAEYLLQMKAIYEQLYHNAQGVGRVFRYLSTVEPFSKWLAAQTELTQDTIYNHLRMVILIVSEVWEAIRRTPIANDERKLRQLASLPPDWQRHVAKILIDHPEKQNSINELFIQICCLEQELARKNKCYIERAELLSWWSFLYETLYPEARYDFRFNESAWHGRVKRLIGRLFAKHSVQYEASLQLGELVRRRTDVLVHYTDGLRFAVECQESAMSVGEWLSRMMDYTILKTPVLWIWSLDRITLGKWRFIVHYMDWFHNADKSERKIAIPEEIAWIHQNFYERLEGMWVADDLGTLARCMIDVDSDKRSGVVMIFPVASIGEPIVRYADMNGFLAEKFPLVDFWPINLDWRMLDEFPI